MRQIYPFIIAVFCVAASVISTKVQAQCPSGYIPDGIAFDTTINFSSGEVSAILKFPKFDPTVGMVTCAKLTMEMTGYLNTLWIENYDASGKITTANFKRNDTISGDGLITPLLNAESHIYGPYTLSPSDGMSNSGSDYISIPSGQIFTESRSIIITNAADLSIFYGPVGDSLTYYYNVNSRTDIDITGNWLGGVLTSGSITYRLEYCYCPVEILPINVYDFTLKKTDANKVQLEWNAENDLQQYYYQIEYSTDGINFTTAGIVAKTDGNNNVLTYNYLFEKSTDDETFFFRIRQRYASGKQLLSPVKSIDLINLQSFSFSLYPNPSNGIIGIKFDIHKSRKLLVAVTNTSGQTVLNKFIEITDGNYRQIASLQKGIYWLKVMDVASQESCVKQLFIK